MTEALLKGLSITGLGMGLVFLMIIVLWGIMALLVRLTNRPEKEAETDDLESPASAEPRTYAAQAAAAAVAYALTVGKQAAVRTSHTQSQWLLSGRVRQTLHNPGKGQRK
jgi:Oxaloacetate decarboxylase, gamma chain.